MSKTSPTMETHLGVASRFLPETLISAQALSRIQEIARQLPAAPLTIFESRLGEILPDLDFLVCTSPAWVVSPGTSQLASQHHAWRNVNEFCRQWVQSPPESWLKQGVDSVWLEFDTSQNPYHPVVPGIFFASLEVCVLQTSLAEHRQAVLAALAHMPNKEVWPYDTIHRCIAALPESGRVYALGDMNGRSASALRVAISQIPTHQLLSYLNKIEWPGDLGKVEAMTRPLAHLTNHVNIDLDVGDTIAPLLGIEFTTPTRFQRSWWSDLLNKLVELDLCLPAKRDALLCWQGYSDETRNTAVSSSSANFVTNNRPIHLMVRFINHIKIVYHPGYSLQAKAYLAMRQVNTFRRSLS